MDNTSPLFPDTPNPTGDSETAAVLPPSPPIETSTSIKRTLPRLWIIAIGVIGAGLITVLIVNTIINKPPVPISEVPQAATPTPTPVRILSSIATQSAFSVLNQTHASLSAGLTATNLDDPILSPPVLELPLGFKP